MKILIIFLAGVTIGYLLRRYTEATQRKNTEQTRNDIGAYVAGQQSEKTARKEKILEMFQKQETIRNDDVENLLGVSDASATNYLNELEREGKIKQIGTTGRFVTYRRQNP